MSAAVLSARAKGSLRCRGVRSPPPHPLAAVLSAAAAGRFPAVDGSTEVLRPDDDGTRAVVAFTGHAYVLADIAPTIPGGTAGGYGGALAPAVLAALAGDTHDVGSTDVVMVAAPPEVAASTPGDALVELGPDDVRRHHPRVQRALAHRRAVRVFADHDGVVVLGRGLVGRLELSLELFDADSVSVGAGRRLIRAGLARAPAGAPCWAQVAAGNARSLRAFLAAGFVPVGAEVLIVARSSR